MADLSEDYIECEIQYNLSPRGVALYSPSYNDYIWITKTGTRIKVRDMTNKHILNAYNMLNRNCVNRSSLDILSRDMKRRGIDIPALNPLWDCDATESDIY